MEAERLDLNTVSGAIRGERLAGRWTIHSTSGSVSLDRAGGGGECSTTSGAIRMNISPLEYDLRCSTISGRINLQIPRGLPAERQDLQREGLRWRSAAAEWPESERDCGGQRGASGGGELHFGQHCHQLEGGRLLW